MWNKIKFIETKYDIISKSVILIKLKLAYYFFYTFCSALIMTDNWRRRWTSST